MDCAVELFPAAEYPPNVDSNQLDECSSCDDSFSSSPSPEKNTERIEHRTTWESKWELQADAVATNSSRLEELVSQLVAGLQRRDWGLQTLLADISAEPIPDLDPEFSESPPPGRDGMETQLNRLEALLPRAGTIANFLRTIRSVVLDRDTRITELIKNGATLSHSIQQQSQTVVQLSEEKGACMHQLQESEAALAAMRQQCGAAVVDLAVLCDQLVELLRARGHTPSPRSATAEGGLAGEVELLRQLVATLQRTPCCHVSADTAAQEEVLALRAHVRALEGQLEYQQGAVTKAQQDFHRLKDQLWDSMAGLVALGEETPFQIGYKPALPPSSSEWWADTASWFATCTRWLRSGFQQLRSDSAFRSEEQQRRYRLLCASAQKLATLVGRGGQLETESWAEGIEDPAVRWASLQHRMDELVDAVTPSDLSAKEQLAAKEARLAELVARDEQTTHQLQSQAVQLQQLTQLLEHSKEEALSLQTKVDHLTFVVERHNSYSEHRNQDLGEKVHRLAECNWYLEAAVLQREEGLRRLLQSLSTGVLPAALRVTPGAEAPRPSPQPAATWDLEFERCRRLPSRVNELAAFDEHIRILVHDRDSTIAHLRLREAELQQRAEAAAKAQADQRDQAQAQRAAAEWREAQSRRAGEELRRWEAEEQFHRSQLGVQEEEDRGLLAVEQTFARTRVVELELCQKERRRRQAEAMYRVAEQEGAERRKLLQQEDDDWRGVLQEEILAGTLVQEEARRRRDEERRRAEAARLQAEAEWRRAELSRYEVERRELFTDADAARIFVERAQLQEWRDLHREFESRLLHALEQEKRTRKRLCPFIGVEISEGITVDPEHPTRVDPHGLTYHGVKVLGVKGPAARDGLQVNDVITALDGRPTKSLVAFKLAAMLVRPGQVIHLNLLRDGAPCEVFLQTDEKDADEFLPGNRYTRRVVLRSTDLSKLHSGSSGAGGQARVEHDEPVVTSSRLREPSPRRPPLTRGRSHTPTATRHTPTRARYPTPTSAQRDERLPGTPGQHWPTGRA